MKRITYIAFLMSVLLVACGPDTDIFIPDPLFPQGMVTSSISGQIVDEMNQPVEGVMVSLNQLNRQTDANGFFNFKNVQVDAQRTMLTASKSGYFESGRAIIPAKESTSQIKIKLLEKTIVANFDGANGGSVDLPQNVVMDVPSDAVLDQNNVGYSGEVQVAAHTLNPEFLDGLEKIPTDLKGKNTSNENQLLESYGMFLFEWSDPNDQKLSIVPGKKITFLFTVSTSRIANAPSEISLWYFDGLDWVEEGTAVLDGGNYVGEIGKSGFWNCARPHDFISVKGVLKNENDQPLSHMPFSIGIENGGVMGFNFNESNGTFLANVPKNLASQITILDECNDMDYLADIGALGEDALVSNVKISNSLDFSKFEGTLLDCNNTNVQSGYVILTVDTKKYFFPIANGIFKADINACDILNATLVAYDVENQKQSEPLQLDVVANVDAGEINVCF